MGKRGVNIERLKGPLLAPIGVATFEPWAHSVYGLRTYPSNLELISETGPDRRGGLDSKGLGH